MNNRICHRKHYIRALINYNICHGKYYGINSVVSQFLAPLFNAIGYPIISCALLCKYIVKFP